MSKWVVQADSLVNDCPKWEICHKKNARQGRFIKTLDKNINLPSARHIVVNAYKHWIKPDEAP